MPESTATKAVSYTTPRDTIFGAETVMIKLDNQTEASRAGAEAFWSRWVVSRVNALAD
jgi:hypothetical protein